MKEQGVAVDPEIFDREVAAGVTCTRSLNLYNPGAEVGEAETCRGSGEVLAEFQYREPIERKLVHTVCVVGFFFRLSWYSWSRHCSVLRQSLFPRRYSRIGSPPWSWK